MPTNLSALVDAHKAAEAEARGQAIADLLSSASDEELSSFRTEAATEYKTVRASEDLTPEQVELLEAYATITSESLKVEGIRQESAAKLAALDGVIEQAASKKEEPDTPDAPQADAEPDPPKQQEDKSGDFSLGKLPKGATDDAKKTAAAKPTNVFAATDALGKPSGEAFGSVIEIANAVTQRIQRYSGSRAGVSAAPVRNGVAVFRRTIDPELNIDGKEGPALEAVFDRAADQARLPGGSLTAAGGWCAPSETLYDLCEDNSTNFGIIGLPEVTGSRGGIRYSSGTDLATLFANANVGKVLTEANVIAGTAKVPVEVPCPTPVETRMDVVYSWVNSPILTRHAYPEQVANFIQKVLSAHRHKVNASVIGRMAAASVAQDLSNFGSTTTVTDTSAASNVLESADLVGEDLRDKYRLDEDATIEGVAPSWVRSIIRADLARRNGIDKFDVTNAMIDTWFAVRNVRMQWARDWQTFNSTPQTTWFAEAQIMYYVPGTLIKLSDDVLTLDTLYDSTNLAQNMYSALFTEEGLAVVKRCFESRLVTVKVCPSGTTGSQNGVCPAPTS